MSLDQSSILSSSRIVAAPRKDQVYGILRRAIINAELVPGQSIPKEAIAAQLGVSRTPLNDALARLADEGLVVIYPQAGTFVSQILTSTIATAQFVRLALETAAVERVAKDANAAMLTALRLNFDQQQRAAEAQDFEKFHNLDEAMHDLICAATGLSGLKEIVARERSQIDRVRRLLLHYQHRMEASITEHDAIIASIEAGQPAKAVAAMAFHVSQMSALLQNLKAEKPDLFGD